MTSITPLTPYSPTELAFLYPSSLTLHKIHILLRHGERTPVRKRFVHLNHPQLWPYCRHSRILRTLLTIPSPSQSSDLTTLEFHWRRKLTKLADNGSVILQTASEGHDVGDLCSLGTLTDAGRQTTHALGTHLRQLYVTSLGFLPPKLTTQSLLSLRTTQYPRALESLQHAVAGLYPPSNRAPDLPPFEIIMTDFSNETLFPNTSACARLNEITKAFQLRAAAKWDHSPAMDKVNMMIGPYLTPDPNSTVRTTIMGSGAPTVVGILDSINASRATGTTSGTRLPKEFYNPDVISTLEQASVDEWYSQYAESAESRRLGMGPLLSSITADLVASAEGFSRKSKTATTTTATATTAPEAKFAISGCHDTTLASMLTSLGVSDGRWPPFTSHIALELFRTTSLPSLKSPQTSWFGLSSAPVAIGRKSLSELTAAQKKALDGYYVRIRYNDRPVVVPACRAERKHWKDDESFCTLAAFKEVVDGMTPRDYRKECNENLGKPGIPNQLEPAGY